MTTYFLSDIHLGAPYFPDSREAERRVVAFLDLIKQDADTIYLLGDILDYWYEYRYVVPRGFVRFFGKLAELADMGIRIVWFIGNHDIWIFDYLPKELGIEVVDGWLVDEIDGRKFFMTHGDGVGRLKPSFRLLRRLFRSKLCQKAFSGIHPRWTVPFAYNWSAHSRCNGCLPTKADAERMLSNIRTFSRGYLVEHPDTTYFIYGHLHLLERFEVDARRGSVSNSADASGENNLKAEVLVLGEWLSKYSFARWNGKKLELLLYRDGTIVPAENI